MTELKIQNDGDTLDVIDLFTKIPLYAKVPLVDDDQEALMALLDGGIAHDIYCVGCKRETPFKNLRIGNVQRSTRKWMFEWSWQTVSLHCQRREGHVYRYQFTLLYNLDPSKAASRVSIVKAGQLPSMEDIASSDVRRFRSLLDPGDFSELHRAGGLVSHGIGIAAFVYLRRIFERLLKKHYELAIASGWTCSDFEKLRIEEKIAELRNFLPPALVKHRAAYKILSKGLHELDEQTCLSYFPVVRAAIVQILEQDLQASERQKAEAALESEMRKITGQIAEQT